MKKQKKHKDDVQGHPWSLKDTPWGQEAEHANKTHGWPINSCRDAVILHYLIAGDTRPLAALLTLGRAPGPAVLRYLSAMLQPADGTEDKVPFRLNVKDRLGRKGRRRDPEIAWRNFLLSENVERKMEEGEKYEFGAIPYVASMLSGDDKTGGDKYEQTVRDAYDERHPKKPKPRKSNEK